MSKKSANDAEGTPGKEPALKSESAGSSAATGASTANGTAPNTEIVEETRQELMKLLANAEQKDAQHAFWSTQPVPQFGSEPSSELEALGPAGGPIETKKLSDVKDAPLALIDGFEWCDVDITSDAELEEAYQLLNMHYVEDEEQMFRFAYSRAFLKWALMPPGWKASWHVGVRVKATKRLVALITAVPGIVDVYQKSVNMVEINFLCVHKKLRAKRLAPVLIQEITRRVNLENIWQAVYTAGAVLPSPVTSSRYYHRSLNPKKLIEIGFSRIAPRMTMTRTIKLNALKPETSISGIRPMVPADVPKACKLLMDHNKRYDLRINYSEDDFAHWFLPRDEVIYTFVVEDAEGGLTDMASFYSLPSSIIRNPKHKELRAAYSFCNIAVTVGSEELMQDTLILANNLGFDVFNALDLARNDEFLKECKFHIGDGDLQFYIYNWMCKPMDRRKNGLVLL